MTSTHPTTADLVSTIHREAAVAAMAACRFLDLIGFPREAVPLTFIMGLAARVRFIEWEVTGWGFLVPPEHRPTQDGLVKFVQDALDGRPIEPALSSPPSAFQQYFAALVYKTGWSATLELRAPVALNRVRRFSPAELATLADFLWKHRLVGCN